MKHLQKVWIALFIMLAAAGIMPAPYIHAASAEVNLTTEHKEVTIGDKFFVSILISSDTEFGDFEANVLYDEEMLEYQKGSNAIAGSSGFLRIRDMDSSSGETSRKYLLEFQANQIGTASITFTSPIMVYDYETGIEMAVSHNELTIEVKPEKTASNNGFLKSLVIRPSELTPEFNKNIYEYNTTVDYATEALIVNAVREDDNAIIRISGNDSLKEGENKVIITVIAESGDVIEYNINVNRELAPVQDPKDEEIDTEHGDFDVIKSGNDVIIVYNGRYKIITPRTDVKIPDGYIKTKIIVSGNTIEVYAPEDNLESNIVLVYVENETGEASFYQYDKTEKTMQRYIEDTTLSDDVTEPDSTENNDNSKSKKMKKIAIVITLLCVICALLISIAVRFYIGTKGRRKRRK